MSLKIATWNINSVRLRLPLVERFLIDQAPDVLCLQEIKCREAEFPYSAFKKLGYGHVQINGQKGYHGVAIISRHPLDDVDRKEFCGNSDARFIGANVSGHDIRLHNFYVPAGGDIPDPDLNVKFAHKLAFLEEMKDWANVISAQYPRSVLVGDLNVAPLETDVWNHKALLKIVSHTLGEVERLIAVQNAGQWFDAGRFGTPLEEKIFTWWSYRSPNWEASDRGRRLDHVWTTPSLKPKVKSCQVFKDIRNWERPSDHVPVLVHLAD